MHLLVGLGNPGGEYRATRHNAGWFALGAIAEAYGCLDFKKKGKAELSEGVVDGQKVKLLKPLTYMNLSGEAVQATLAFYKIKPEQMIVFHDELALPLGQMKVKFAGGAAGHNGLKSIDQHIGQNYWRVRIGIGHPGERERVTGHVLGNFSKDEQAQVGELNNSIAEHLPLLLEENPSQFIEQTLRKVKK